MGIGSLTCFPWLPRSTGSAKVQDQLDSGSCCMWAAPEDAVSGEVAEGSLTYTNFDMYIENAVSFRLVVAQARQSPYVVDLVSRHARLGDVHSSLTDAQCNLKLFLMIVSFIRCSCSSCQGDAEADLL